MQQIYRILRSTGRAVDKNHLRVAFDDDPLKISWLAIVMASQIVEHSAIWMEQLLLAFYHNYFNMLIFDKIPTKAISFGWNLDASTLIFIYSSGEEQVFRSNPCASSSRISNQHLQDNLGENSWKEHYSISYHQRGWQVD